ncbi:MAG: DNA repair protein RadC, partial [Spartobacteria bacterium]|nr:DNA repair protein RadC [Spartobacteria bacterium]
SELASIRGMGKVKAQVLKCALDIGRRMIEEAVPERAVVHTPDMAARILRMTTRSRTEESFWVLGLDTKNRLLRAPIEITKGLLDASLVHPREVFREAIRLGCAAIILGHNHPSGDPTPSGEDLRITRQLVEAGKIINISVLDHVVIGHHVQNGGSDFISLRETGLVNFEV